MQADPNIDEAVVPTVEKLLGAAWSGLVRLGNHDTLRERACYRFIIAEGPEGAPKSVIVKLPRYIPELPADPDSTEPNPAHSTLNEWAGLAFLSDVAPNWGLAPAFYGGNRSKCLIIFEDLGKRSSLADPLMGEDPDLARHALVLHARAVADLHARTFGKEDIFWKIRDSLGPRVRPLGQGWGDLRDLKPKLQESFEHIGQHVSGTFWDEYESLVDSIGNPSPFRAYTHNDSCPDNSVLESNRLRLFDFEVGGYRLCLLDAAYCRLCMPHCYLVNRLPADVAPIVEAAYRERLSTSLPLILDDRLFGEKLTDACAYWMISNGTWIVKRNFDEDFTWGISTWWQRVLLRLELFADTTVEFSHLTAMGNAARETLRIMKTHWNCEPMPLYPPFR